MDFQKLSLFVIALGILVMIPGIIICLSNLPVSFSPPAEEKQFSWKSWMEQHTDPTKSAAGMYLLNQERAQRRIQGYWFLGVGGVIAFAGFALRKSVIPRNASEASNTSDTQADGMYYIRRQYEKAYGPFRVDEIRSKVVAGEIGRDGFARLHDSDDWMTIGKLLDIHTGRMST